MMLLKTISFYSISIGDIITGFEAIILLITLVFMYHQYRKTIKIMQEELKSIQNEIRITTHEDIYEKLFNFYYKYIEYAPDVKDVFASQKDLTISEIRKQYMVFAILDILYLMYLEKDTLDKGLLKTWQVWVKKIFEEPTIFEIYQNVKDEYDPEYIQYIHDLYNEKLKNSGS